MFLMVLTTLSQGISDTMTTAAKLLVTGDINVGGFYKTRANNAALVLTPGKRYPRGDSSTTSPRWSGPPTGRGAGAN